MKSGKKISVILKRAVPNLGKEGEVVAVKHGYARNFLYTTGAAIYADKNQLRALDRRKVAAAGAMAELRADAEKKQATVNGVSLRIPGKVGADGNRLFGAITNADVAEALKSQLGLEVERKAIALVQPIKRLGDYPVRIDLHPEVDATVNVVVFDPNAKVEEAPVEEAPEAEEEV